MKQYKFTLKPSFRPFLINENLDENPITKEKLFETKFMGGDNASAVRNKISSEGEKEGIQFNWDKNAKVRQTKAAHRVLERAYETGGFALQSKVADKLYTAFHSDAIDVGEPTELAKIASSEPEFMSYDDALKFVQSDSGEYELDKALEKCKHYGIDSVPFFILDETESITEAISAEEWHKRFNVLARAYGLAD